MGRERVRRKVAGPKRSATERQSDRHVRGIVRQVDCVTEVVVVAEVVAVEVSWGTVGEVTRQVARCWRAAGRLAV